MHRGEVERTADERVTVARRCRGRARVASAPTADSTAAAPIARTKPLTMPPLPFEYQGHEAISLFLSDVSFQGGARQTRTRRSHMRTAWWRSPCTGT